MSSKSGILSTQVAVDPVAAVCNQTPRCRASASTLSYSHELGSYGRRRLRVGFIVVACSCCPGERTCDVRQPQGLPLRPDTSDKPFSDRVEVVRAFGEATVPVPVGIATMVWMIHKIARGESLSAEGVRADDYPAKRIGVSARRVQTWRA